MAMRDGKRRARRVNAGAASVLALLVVSCGEFASWDERWIVDGDGQGGHHPSAPSTEPALPSACEAEPLEGYRYAEPPEHWLGSYEDFDVSVSGLGYLAAGAGDDPSERRFSRGGGLGVAADGTIILGGEPALGYAPEAIADQCLVELRAPIAAPPRATTFVNVVANFDPRAYVPTFDLLDPAGSSNGSFSFTVFDSVGVTHILDVYHLNLGLRQISYHLLADGGEIAGGVPGTPIELGYDVLQFDENGALVAGLNATFQVSFAGAAAPNQRIAFGWGSHANWADGIGGDSTSLPEADQLFSLSSNGFRPGTGVGVYVEATGEVVAYYDSGEPLSIGTLALARFSREAELAPVADGWIPTPESGGPLYGTPLSGGRGAILIGAPPR